MRIFELLTVISSRSCFVIAALALLFVAGCDSMESGEESVDVDIDALFSMPLPDELALIRSDWASRDVSALDVEILVTDTIQAFGASQVVNIVSHSVAGVTHMGAVMAPVAAQSGSLPILVYNHPGDDGVDLNGTIALVAFGLGGIASDFVFIVPSFRAEALTFNGIDYESEGPPSPWDLDVDDSIALLNVALDLTPEADASRIGVLGVSRGAGVSLLMAARDARVDFVINYFGPTNFLLESSREETVNALNGDVRDLPGLSFLTETYLIPLQEGTRTIDEVRLEYIRRSPVFFTETLPLLQVHHGEQDDIVPVAHAISLEQSLMDAGKPDSEFDVFIYPTAGHDVIEMPESFSRAVDFFNENIGM